MSTIINLVQHLAIRISSQLCQFALPSAGGPPWPTGRNSVAKYRNGRISRIQPLNCPTEFRKRLLEGPSLGHSWAMVHASVMGTAGPVHPGSCCHRVCVRRVRGGVCRRSVWWRVIKAKIKRYCLDGVMGCSGDRWSGGNWVGIGGVACSSADFYESGRICHWMEAEALGFLLCCI